MQATDHGKLVVGVDGSDGSLEALRWATKEAVVRLARLVAVHAWEVPYLGELSGVRDYEKAHAEFENHANEVLAAAVKRAEAPEGMRVESLLLHGAAAGVLVTAAREADLLVVGSRGRGGFASLMLGSVSQQCAQHAPCPVVIVPGARKAAA